MLKPLEMQKVRIIAIKEAAEVLIRDLHELGLVEIRSFSHDYGGLESGRPLEFYNEISEELVRMRAIKNALGAYAKEKASVPPVSGREALLEAKTIALDSELKAKQDAISSLENELKRLQEEKSTIELLSVFGGIDFSKLNGTSTSYIVGTFKLEKLETMKQKLYKALKHYNVHYVSRGKAGIALVVFSKRAQDLEAELSECEFVKISVPEYMVTPGESLDIAKGKISEKTAAMAAIKDELSKIAKDSFFKISSLEKTLSIEADRAEIASRFGATSSTYIIEGWIKKNEYQKLESLLLGKHEHSLFMEKIAADHDDEPPIVLKNPGIVHPLEYITKTYSLPNYHDIDPTFFYFIMLPLIYGMIVGDVLYGLISIPLALFFLKKFSKSYVMKNVSMIWLYGTIPSILFGIYFDEWGGTTHFYWVEVLGKWGINLGINTPLYAGLSRIHDLTTVVGLTLALGLVHIALGLVLGALNSFGHSKKHALAKVSWLGVEAGGTIAVMAFLLNVLPSGIGNMGAGILGLSAVGLYLTEGVVGVVEIPSMAGNVLSYLRIAVVGVVGSILAELINEMLMPLPGQGIMALAFFPLFIGLHALNTFIAMFEAMIQGGRLNILEFKSKFVVGGGKLFDPFILR